MTDPELQQEAERIQKIKHWAVDPTHLGGHAFNDLRWLLALLESRDQRIREADVLLLAASGHVSDVWVEGYKRWRAGEPIEFPPGPQGPQEEKVRA